MPKITALIHTKNDAQRIGRAIESLRPCDEVLIVDHGSEDETRHNARHHGATVITGVPGVDHGTYLVDARHDWILCLRASEALTEGLEAALFEWKEGDAGDVNGYSVPVRVEEENGWTTLPPETRLVNRNRLNWTTDLPPNDPKAPQLHGDLLRFRTP